MSMKKAKHAAFAEHEQTSLDPRFLHFCRTGF